jgi:acyl-coenzyme A thioesterase PaaI-like protein
MDPEIKLDPRTFGPEQQCFGCSPFNPIGFQLEFAREGDEVVARFTPGTQFDGPPGILHGGLQATLADEVAAWTLVGLRGRMGFTASMEFRLLRPVRTSRLVEARGRIAKESPRLITVETRLIQDGEVAMTGTLVFAIPDEQGARRVLGRDLPAEWRKLCRT